MASKKKASSAPKPAVKKPSAKRAPKTAPAAPKRGSASVKPGSPAKKPPRASAPAGGAHSKPRPRSASAAKPLPFRAVVDLRLLLERVRPLWPVDPQYTLRRPEDLAVGTIVAHNLRVSPGAPPQLVRSNPAAESYLIFVLPPQSFGEEAFLDATDPGKNEGPEVTDAPGYPKKNSPGNNPPGKPADPTGPLPAAKMRMSGTSRIAVTMPAGLSAVDFTFEKVLEACRTWPLRLDLNAAPEPRILGLRPELLGAVPLDSQWLQTVVASAGWRDLNHALESALAGSGGAPLVQALRSAGAAVGRRSVEVLRSGATAAAGRELEKALTAGVEGLSGRFPALREAQARQAALGLVSISATEAGWPAAGHASRSPPRR